MSSDYMKGLDDVARQRYEEKLQWRGEELPDPLDRDVLQFNFATGAKNLPPVTAADIFMYLVEGVCFYTKEQFKCYKLSDAYNMFVSGKVRQLASFKVGERGDGIVILAAKVEASQTLTKQYEPWCIVKDDGSVVTAHCTCMAGLGECCTHVAALLFYTEAHVNLGMNNTSPTDVPCKWIEVSRKTAAAPVSEIDFFKPKVGAPVPQPTPRAQRDVPQWTNEQVRSFCSQLKKNAPATLLLTSVTDSEATDSAPETADHCPEPPTKQRKVSATFPLGDIYKDVDLGTAVGMKLSDSQCVGIEEKTRGQSQSPTWLDERKGRITASILHRATTCKSGADGLVAEIMGYVKAPRVSNILWGLQMESEAKTAFMNHERDKHSDFMLSECGLHVMPEVPFIAASPDALVSCTCCEKAVLEIKCPASLKANPSVKNFKRLAYLDENLKLRHNHAYYAQVQAQMAASVLRKAYFVVFTGECLTVEIIYFDATFWAAILQKATTFFFNHVFPELQSQRICKQIESAKRTCECHGTKSGRVTECSICTTAFHLKCIKLKRTPKSWVCTKCVNACTV